AIFFDDFAGFEFAVAGVHDLNVVDAAAALHFAVRRLDEAVVVDARKAGERADQSDVRTFRRFDRADAAIVGRVNVADFETGAFHADEADAELVFEQFADGANAAVTEVVDVVDDADVLAQLEQILDGGDEVRRFERAIIERRIEAELDIELQAADAAEIVLAR